MIRWKDEGKKGLDRKAVTGITLILLLISVSGLEFTRAQFYWKASFSDYVPSGMPDFDQRQFGTYNWTDQYGSWSHCAPVAVANSLWWYDSAYEINTKPPPAMIDNFSLVTAYGPWDDHDPQNVQPLVEHLAYLMDTDGRRTGLAHDFTNVTDIGTGIAQYLSWSEVNPPGDCNGDGKVDQTDWNIVMNAWMSTPGTPGWDMRADIWPATIGFPTPRTADNIVNPLDLALVAQYLGSRNGMFYEHTVPKPDFFFIAEEVEWSHDVVLALGFYGEAGPGDYYKIHYPPGHAVTVAGINSNSMQIGISDPGRSGLPYAYNNASLVSHDIYGVTFNPVMGMWELVGYSTPPKHAFIENAVITAPRKQSPSGGVRLHLVVDVEDVYAGAIVGAIAQNLANIGISVAVEYRNATTIADTVWGAYWNKTWYEAPGLGWDLFISDWRMMPTGLVPLESLVYSWATPPNGSNIMSWMNEDTDTLLWMGMRDFHAVARKTWLWVWQREFMHDPPMVSLYCPRMYEVTGVWVEGWDPVVRFQDVSHLAVNNTAFQLYAPSNRMLIGNDTLIYGVAEDLWDFNPLFMSTATQEKLSLLTHDTLYALSVDPWPATGVEPDPWNYSMRPDLAANNSIWLDGPNGPNTRVRVSLRPNVTWNDGYPFNATDVKFTFDLILNPDTKAAAYGDFALVVESVEIVNSTCVDLVLYEPYADITTLLGIPGATIIPWHILKDVSPSTLRSHPTNLNWTQYLPGTGPFNMTGYVSDVYINLTRNELYFGYNASIVNPAGTPYGPYGEPYWGPYNITTLIFYWISDRDDRLLALQVNEIDFCQPIAAPIGVFQDMASWPSHKVWQYNGPSSNFLFFNLNNPIPSNRYVRQAIAHAIPYDFIINQILPAYGIETSLRGLTPILPYHYYTEPDVPSDPGLNGETVRLFNEDLQPYEYDMTKAQQYMNMWKHSGVWTDWTEWGPVGDADFSGLVELADFYVWRRNFGTTSVQWSFDPGWDIDPDFDNNNLVDMYDFYYWRERFGFYYP